MRTTIASSLVGLLACVATPAVASYVHPGNTLFSGESLGRDSLMYSNNGCFVLAMQNDGNLVIYKNQTGQAIWATNTDGVAVEQAVMQTDGNLVLYRYNGSAVWATGTDGRDGSRVVMQDDGNLVIYTPVFNRPVWASNTVTGCN